jgi:hypothetical protein
MAARLPHPRTRQAPEPTDVQEGPVAAEPSSDRARDDTASLVAARQLAEEARLRRRWSGTRRGLVVRLRRRTAARIFPR